MFFGVWFVRFDCLVVSCLGMVYFECGVDFVGQDDVVWICVGFGGVEVVYYVGVVDLVFEVDEFK